MITVLPGLPFGRNDMRTTADSFSTAEVFAKLYDPIDQHSRDSPNLGLALC
jgi:hypothetical protein